MTAACVFAIASIAFGQTSDLTYVQTITTGLDYPARLAPAPGGGVFVTDTENNQVLALDSSGVVTATYAVSQGPVGIAVHPDGRVFVSRLDGRIGVYSATLTSLGTVDPAPMTMTAPNDLAMHSGTSELYAVDAGGNQVLVFAESAPGTWTLARAWGIGGAGLGQFYTPQAIAIDEALGRVIVTDNDNGRLQVFDTSGVLLFKFGYRILYTSGSEVAWFARSSGLAIDECSNMYIADALMGTVRVFDSAAREIDSDHLPAIGYGTGAGQLRTPCDLLIDSTATLFVANTSNAAIEVFDVACTGGALAAVPSEPVNMPRGTSAVRHASLRKNDALRPVPRGVTVYPDDPTDIAAAINSGTYREDYDVNDDRAVDLTDLEMAVDHFGAGTVEKFLLLAEGSVATHDALAPPHIVDIPNRCGRCHAFDGAPGGMLSSAGQENLCISCHSVGQIAGSAVVGSGDRGTSHPWGVLASNADPGPAPGSDIALHLDGGNVRCGTCHEPHESSAGVCQIPSPIPGWAFPSHIGSCAGGVLNGHPCQKDSQCAQSFIRSGDDRVSLCGECHVQYEEWLEAGHAHEHADPWSHYDWSMGNNWLCTGPGTPYPYCTGEGAGTAASPAAAPCTGPGTPMACCTGPGVGSTCTVANAGCTGPGTPWACCLGTGTGNCANNLSAAACTGVGTPMSCCTGVGTGSCSSREACRQCHSGNGYIDFSNDFPDGTVATSTHRGMFRVVDCLVCHATHGEAQGDELLRIYDTVRLPTGQVLTDVGSSATCMSCHNGRALPPIPNPPGVSTPHYLSGGVMLEGINGVTTFDGVTYTVASSTHTSLLNAGVLDCATCHMAAVPTSGPGAGKVGGHTFNIVDHETGFENVDNTCNSAGCHSGLTTVDRPANGDYDGNGIIEGVQAETAGMLEVLKGALYAAGASRLLVNGETGLPTTEPQICTGAGTPLACCTGAQTGPGCVDPDAEPTNPYWTTTRCSGGSRAGLPCRGTGVGTAPFDCPGSTCVATVPAGDLATVEDAIWNWEYVDNSGDLGVKNTGYAIGLLQVAYKGVANAPVPGAIVSYRYSPAP